MTCSPNPTSLVEIGDVDGALGLSEREGGVKIDVLDGQSCEGGLFICLAEKCTESVVFVSFFERSIMRSLVVEVVDD